MHKKLCWRAALKESLIWLGLLWPLALYGVASLGRPPRTQILNQPLFQGIVYSRRINTQPRPQVTHILDIDLTAPSLQPFVTPGFETAQPNVGAGSGQETLAQRTSDFLRIHQLQVAVNANVFYPFEERALWSYEPRDGRPVNLRGIAISNGEIVSLPEQKRRPALCFLSQRAEIHGSGNCPEHTEQAIAGNLVLLQNGQLPKPIQRAFKRVVQEPYPINIAALDPSGARLWLVLGDGKQPLYSEGPTLQEATALVQDLGAEIAIRLDGGGSTTLAIATENGPRILNAVIQAKVPGQERPVANHLGFFASPLHP